MQNSKAVAKRYIETEVISKLAESKNIDIKKAIAMLYGTKTYKWFADDAHGIAREGVDAIYCRVVNELDGDLII